MNNKLKKDPHISLTPDYETLETLRKFLKENFQRKI